MLLSLNANVATITLDRPDNGNRVDGETADALGEACRLISEDDGLRLVVLTANGTVFSIDVGSAATGKPGVPVAGLAGLGEVAGIHGNMPDGISPGFGFIGIVVALLGGLHPLWIILSSLFFSALLVGAESMQRVVGIPVSMVWVLQGLIVICILASRLLTKDTSS